MLSPQMKKYYFRYSYESNKIPQFSKWLASVAAQNSLAQFQFKYFVPTGVFLNNHRDDNDNYIHIVYGDLYFTCNPISKSPQGIHMAN